MSTKPGKPRNSARASGFSSRHTQETVSMSTFVKTWLVAASIPALALGASLASAHPSPPQFDFSKRITVEGTVERFEVKNPHAVAVIAVKDAKGAHNVEYEGHSASHFYRAGYTRD